MPLYDIDGTTTGAASVNGSVTLIHNIVDPIVGAANVGGSTIGVFYVSGHVTGAGDLIDDSIADIAGIADGGSNVTADLLRRVGVRGQTHGEGHLNFSEYDPIYGVAVVTAYMDVVHVPPPICEAPVVSVGFRWGHIFTWGDLIYSVIDGSGKPYDPEAVGYTMYQMQPGCALEQIGPGNQRPAKHKLGCYYVTGTAGECGQPGLWMVRWCYQRTYNDPVVEEDCYFQVLDAISCPVTGDTLERYCKYGWDE